MVADVWVNGLKQAVAKHSLQRVATFQMKSPSLSSRQVT